MNEKCEELEVLEGRNDHFAVHKKIKEVVGRNRKSNIFALIDCNNRAVVDTEGIKIHWKSYIEQLFKSVEQRHIEIIDILEEKT